MGAGADDRFVGMNNIKVFCLSTGMPCEFAAAAQPEWKKAGPDGELNPRLQSWRGSERRSSSFLIIPNRPITARFSAWDAWTENQVD